MKSALLLSLLFSISVRAKIPKRFDYPLEGTDLIYGNDDRYEVDDYPNSAFIEKAKSVALKVPNRKLSEDREDPTFMNFSTRKLRQMVSQICPAERFIDQVSLGECSGFLISPTHLVTAGHCVLDTSDCSSSKWVFDFKEDTKILPKSNIYSCKKIVTQKYVYSKMQVNDYAIIELDRAVLGRAPLRYRKIGLVARNTPLVLIGHPMGLPMKITDGGRVSGFNDLERKTTSHSFFLRRNYFTANLDAFAGNSGSPVFNYETGKVEGILIQGAEDFTYNPEKKCLESRHLTNDSLNTYERVMRINHVPGL